MPFTPAHVAAVLPVVGRRGRWVVPAAWVVGSMSPDLVYFTPAGWVRPLSHSFTGLLTLDPVLGVLVLAVWWTLLGPAGRDLLPRAWRARTAEPHAPSRDRWGWALVGLLGGSVTHVAWDAFTHHDGAVVTRVPVLGDPLLGAMPAYAVLQLLSGILGLAVVAWWCRSKLRRADPLPGDGQPRPGVADVAAGVLDDRERRAARTLVVVLPLVFGVGLSALGFAVGLPLLSSLFIGLTRAVGICTLVATIAAVGWRELRRRRRGLVPSPV